MKKILQASILGILLFIFFLFKTINFNFIVRADSDNCDPTKISDTGVIDKCISDTEKDLESSINATRPSETQLNDIKARVAFIETDLVNKKKEIDDGYINLENKKIIFDKTVAKNYIESYNSNWLSDLIGSQATGIIQNLAYQKAKADQDKAIITNIALTITDLEEKRKSLVSEEARLAVIKIQLDKIVTEAKAYQASLSNKIAALSARQQEILSQRLSSLGIPLFASSPGACSSDIGKDPGFSGAFGFFTYGVPNRVGLNQYGAWGRAKAGQRYEEILHAYYNFDSIDNRSATINVDGYGSYSLEDYVKRVYEVPASWTDNDSAALKAQAIAARSYALAYTNNGQGSICTTQQCQVFKPDPKTENNNAWINAVDATSGKVMIQGGSPVKAWFSSTHGGYIHSSGDIGWSDTSFTKNAQDASGSINNFSDLKNNAYDKDSPWFYCDWGGRSDYNKTAWLKSDEVADIVNVIMLARADSSVNEHLYQTDRSNPAGTDTWDAGRVKSELQNRGITPFNSVSGLNVDVDWGAGKVTTVHVSGDAPDPSISGNFFKLYFDLRAPANIQIVGPLYNVERN